MREGVDKLFSVNDDDFKLFFIWANEDWDSPSLGMTDKIKNSYNNIDFDRNINNLIPYFKNKKYLKENNKLFLIQ